MFVCASLPLPNVRCPFFPQSVTHFVAYEDICGNLHRVSVSLFAVCHTLESSLDRDSHVLRKTRESRWIEISLEADVCCPSTFFARLSIDCVRFLNISCMASGAADGVVACAAACAACCCCTCISHCCWKGGSCPSGCPPPPAFVATCTVHCANKIIEQVCPLHLSNARKHLLAVLLGQVYFAVPPTMSLLQAFARLSKLHAMLVETHEVRSHANQDCSY